MSEKQRRARFISLRVKLLLGFTVLFTLVFSVAFLWYYGFADDRAMQRISEDLKITLEGAAEGIDGDELVALYQQGEETYGEDVVFCGCYWEAELEEGVEPSESDAARLLEEAKENCGENVVSLGCEEGLCAFYRACSGEEVDPALYEKQLTWLEKVHQLEKRAWPYLYVKSDNADAPYEVVFIGDLWERYDEDKAIPFLLHYTAEQDPEILIYGLEKTTMYELYEDEWGRWFSGYAPIYSESTGEPVAGIGVDFEASYVYEVRQSIITTMLPVFLIAIAALLVLVYVISTGLSRPVIALTAVAERVAEGDYEQDISALYSGRLRDEVSTLAHVFEMMVDQVHAREARLKRQVRELRIEIDQAKRDRHVAEITDTDYFRDLQQKARALRGRTESSEEPSEE